MSTPATQPHSALFDRIEQIIASQPIVVFMKGTPAQPLCGFSNYVVQIMQKLNIDFLGVDILKDEDLRQGIKDFSQWPTIPQVYIKGEFIGGADIMRDIYTSGELVDILNRHAIPYNESVNNA